jgi:lipopolysaccharide export system permease protein
MKKIDKLILSSFLGPFILTFLVVVFILLTQHMIKYFDDIVGKDLGWDVLGTLLFYFAVFMTPIAIPLAVLLSSLITFGNLGEHLELTAIKASGISLLRALLPIFFFVLLLTVFAFYSNNRFVPRAALEAYSLLYDIKQKKPSMDLQEGAFYNGIPDFSIKVEKKYDDGQKLKDIIIYDHSQKNGNKEITIADSGRMYTINNDRYLKLELYDGNTYVEGNDDIKGGKENKQEFTQSSFKKSQIVLDLSSFQMDRTDKDLFSSNRNMRNLSELEMDVDSMNREIIDNRLNNFLLTNSAFSYLFRRNDILMPDYLQEHRERKIEKAMSESAAEPFMEDKIPSEVPQRKEVLGKAQTIASAKTKPQIVAKPLLPVTLGKNVEKAVNEIRDKQANEQDYSSALSNVRQIKSRVEANKNRVQRAEYVKNVHQIQWHKIIANSVACISMFLIGAPLGAIIKKGGLGVPVLVSIFFFIIFYVINMMGEKYAKQNILDPWMGIWAANIILLPVGIFFLRQARVDARLFDSDFYNVMLDKFNRWISRRRKSKSVVTVNS